MGQTMTPLGDYVFKAENFEDVHCEFKHLFAANHKETGIYDMAFEPDYDRYVSVYRTGGLAFFTVRKLNIPVGYAGFFLDRHIYQKDIVSATQTLTYVAGPHRGISLAFLRFCDKELEGLGVNSIWRHSTSKRDIGKIFARMGYKLIQTAYRKDFKNERG